MAKIKRYDAHCHIFTLKFALKEIKSLLWQIHKGEYQYIKYDKSENDDSSTQESGHKEGLLEFLKQLYEILSSVMGTEQENLDFMQKEAEEVFPDTDFAIIPLMMDVFYMFTTALGKGENVTKADTLKAIYHEDNLDHELAAQNEWKHILNELKKHISTRENSKKDLQEIIENEIDRIHSIIDDEINYTLKSEKSLFSFFDRYGFHKTSGFCYHFDKLSKLVSEREGELYPFLAVDPRRENMIDCIIEGEHILNGPFTGVKLYPRMGYHPQCTPMDKLYSFCEKERIPIITHCGYEGFPPFEGWKYSDFGNPENFRDVLNKYPNLKINFAHFGSGSENYEWAETIVDLIDCFSNVYSDFSCYTADKDIDYALYLWRKYPKTHKKVMYGTDFDVMYYTAPVTMEEYVQRFIDHFSDNDLDLMMTKNVERFLDKSIIKII